MKFWNLNIFASSFSQVLVFLPYFCFLQSDNPNHSSLCCFLFSFFAQSFEIISETSKIVFALRGMTTEEFLVIMNSCTSCHGSICGGRRVNISNKSKYFIPNFLDPFQATMSHTHLLGFFFAVCACAQNTKSKRSEGMEMEKFNTALRLEAVQGRGFTDFYKNYVILKTFLKI